MRLHLQRKDKNIKSVVNLCSPKVKVFYRILENVLIDQTVA